MKLIWNQAKEASPKETQPLLQAIENLLQDWSQIDEKLSKHLIKCQGQTGLGKKKQITKYVNISKRKASIATASL